ncbi:MAG: hypothetical protein ACOYNZ_18005 [Rhodoferax sp.]
MHILNSLCRVLIVGSAARGRLAHAVTPAEQLAAYTNQAWRPVASPNHAQSG